MLSRSLHFKVCPPLVPTPSLSVNSACSQAYISHRDQALLVYEQQNLSTLGRNLHCILVDDDPAIAIHVLSSLSQQ